MHIHTYVAMLYAHKRIISHPNRIWVFFFFFFVLFSALFYLFDNTPQLFRWANKQAHSLDPQMLSAWSEVWVLRGQVKEAVLLPSASRSSPYLSGMGSHLKLGNLPSGCSHPGEHILVEQWPRNPHPHPHPASYMSAGHTINFPKVTDGSCLVSYPILGGAQHLLLSHPSC